MKYTERSLFKKRALIKPAACLTLALSAIVTSYAASAANVDMVQTWQSSSTTPTSTINGVTAPSWGWPNLPTPSDGTQPTTITSAEGSYRVNLNFWNQDITQGNVLTSAMTVNVNDQTGAYNVKATSSSASGFYKANSYYAGSRPQDNKACASGTFNSQDACHWAPNKANPSANPIHAPGSYPSIYNGCHYNQCTKSGTWKDGSAKDGAPYPLQVNQITSIPSHWVVDTSQSAASAVYDVGYDIWFDKNPPRNSSGDIVASGGTPSLPGSPHLVNQNNGLEIMIWINNKGYTQGGTANGGIIQPAGNLRASAVAIPGVTGTWDVWITDSAKSGTAPNDWYVVSYVKVSDSGTGGSGGGTDDFQFDSKYFMNDAANRNCIGEKCLNPAWWLTSIQAGFEVWADGETLTTKSFTADPTWKPAIVQGGRLWKDDNGNNQPNPDGTNNPVAIVYWGQNFDVTAVCPNPSPNDTGSWAFSGTDPTNGQPYTATGSMKPDATGILVGTVSAPAPAHNWATLNITTVCANGGGGAQTPITFWIDPAGTVKDTNGKPLVGVPVTLYRSDTATGTMTVVPNGSNIMSDKNHKNPSDTGLYGDFAWDVTPGFYKVRAIAPGCHAPGNPSQAFVDSAVFQVPPPALGISLVMECATTGGNNGVTVQLTLNGTDWQNGYCRNIVLTNTTSKAVTWKVNFNLPFPGNLTQTWNINDTKSGNTITAWGIGWNNVLQPGQVLNQQGFCATK